MMKGPGALALVVAVLCAPLAAGARTPLAEKRMNTRNLRVALASSTPYTSPDGRHAALVTATGRVRLDGHPVDAGRGRVQGPVVWRHDSRALAFLQRSHLGLELVVLPRLDGSHPLTWRLPSHADGLTKVIWVGKTRVGVGARSLVPRVMVSWRTRVIAGSRHLY
jgi:hypothetical protein